MHGWSHSQWVNRYRLTLFVFGASSRRLMRMFFPPVPLANLLVAQDTCHAVEDSWGRPDAGGLVGRIRPKYCSVYLENGLQLRRKRHGLRDLDRRVSAQAVLLGTFAPKAPVPAFRYRGDVR